MKNISAYIVACLLLTGCGITRNNNSLQSNPNPERAELFKNYYSVTSLNPTASLLDKLGIENYKLTKKIKIASGSNIAITKSLIRQCDDAYILNIKTLGLIKNIKRVVVGFEQPLSGVIKKLIEVNYVQGSPKVPMYFVKVSVSIPELNGKVGNVWVFMESEKGIQANAAKFKCYEYVQ